MSEAHRKELNVLTSYCLNDFKKKAGATHVDMSANIRRAAFTLAEVLITLGIIGVVAAMTIPTLVSNYKVKTTSVKLKKFYSTMAQAIKMSEVDNGPVAQWIKPDRKFDSSGQEDFEANDENADKFFVKYLAPYLKFSRPMSGKPVIFLADGSKVTFSTGNCFNIDYDINGDALPNQNAEDIFQFGICKPGTIEYSGADFSALYFKYSNTPGAYDVVYDRDTAYANCVSRRQFCTALLQYDSWEFKDDYPY